MAYPVNLIRSDLLVVVLVMISVSLPLTLDIVETAYMATLPMSSVITAQATPIYRLAQILVVAISNTVVLPVRGEPPMLLHDLSPSSVSAVKTDCNHFSVVAR